MAAAQAEEAIRRNRPGCKAKDFYNWPDEDIEQMESTLSVQQYIQQTIRSTPLDVDRILTMPASQEKGVWKYEHMRQFCLDLNDLTVLLQEECLPTACTKMMATDQWVFLCAAHKQPRECSAIDYTRHTLDGAASLLNSNKYFPSRVTIKESAVGKLGSICRRIYRIFAHAYFHHREIFDEHELRTALCLRFTKFVRVFQLMTDDTLIVPTEELLALSDRAQNAVPTPCVSGDEGGSSDDVDDALAAVAAAVDFGDQEEEEEEDESDA